MASLQPAKIISFTKVDLPYGWLGNMAPYPLAYEDLTYWTTATLFQALRRGPGDRCSPAEATRRRGHTNV
jgi:hypothetical protein